MQLKATRDPEVIAKWQRAATACQRKLRFTLPCLFLIAFLCLGFGIHFHNIYGFAFFTLFLLGALVFNVGNRVSLICPHCSRGPLNPFRIGSPLDIDFCPYCLYWLKSPW